MTEIRQPDVSLSLVSADLEVANAPQKVLLVGQMIAGDATAGELVEDIGNSGEESALFQRDSHLAEMVRAFKRIAPQVQLDAIPLADAAGTSAAWDIVVSGTATEAGTILLNAGSDKNHKLTVAVSDGDSAATVATAIESAVDADLNCLFTPNQSAGTCTLTYNNDGLIGNGVPVGIELQGSFSGSIEGLTFTITENAVGATDPTINAATFDVLGNRRYQGIVMPYAGGHDPVATFLDGRFNMNNRVQDGVAFGYTLGTYSQCDAVVTALNSKSLVIFCDESTSADGHYVGASMPENPSVTITSFTALRALRLTADASISRYLTTTASRDQFGGTATASLPYFNSTIPQLPIPRADLGFSDVELEDIVTDGGAVIGKNSTGTGNLVGEVPTTYKTDPAANDDLSWKFLNYVDTMSAVREYFFNNYKKRFAQSRLTEGTVIRGRDMVNRAIFEAYTDRLYGDLSGSDFVLLQDGPSAVKFFKENRTVVLDLSVGKVTVTMRTPIVTQTRTIIGTIQIVFSTEED
jgi:hypothetical protein